METESDNLNVTSVANDVRVCINAHTRGEMGYDVLSIALKGFSLTSSDAAWEVLSLLDQYHRRGALADDVFRGLKEQITRVAFAGRDGSSAVVRNSLRSHSRATPHEPCEPTMVRSLASHSQHTQDNSEPLLVVRDPPANDVKHAAPTQVSAAFRPEPTDKPADERDEPQKIPATDESSLTHVGDHVAAVSPHTASPHTLPSQSHAALTADLASPSNTPRTTKQAALASSIAPGKILNGRFAIESALSFGRCTAVFRARDRGRTDDRENFVALKILLIASAETQAQFKHEQQVAQRLAHPQFVKTGQMHYDSDLPFFTMELIEGKTLGELLEFAPPKRAQAQTIIAKLVDTLAYLHQQGIAHGDINPDNVMISNSNEVKLIDYGAANEFRAGNNDVSLSTRLSSPSILPVYASCQRLIGQAAEPSDDIFSLSCIAYELLTGRHPFNRLPATQARTMGLLPMHIPELRPQQWLSLQRGLAWERGDRIASVEEWFADFSGARDLEVKQPTPAPELNPGRNSELSPKLNPQLNNGPTFEPISAPPRRPAPARNDAAPPPPYQYVARVPAPKQRRWLWPTVVAAIFSVVAGVSIFQSEFGFELRSQLAAQTAGIKTSDTSRTDVPAASTDPAIHATNADANAVTAADSTVIGDSSLHTASSASTSISAADTANVDSALAAKSIEGSSTTSSVASATPKETPKEVNGATSTENGTAAKPSEAHGKIGFSSDTFIVSRHDTYARINIDRNNGTAGKVTFAWWTESGTAEEGKDYMSYGRKTEVLASGKRRMTVFVPLIADLNKSNGHVFFVNIGDPSNGLTLGRITRAKVIFADD